MLSVVIRPFKAGGKFYSVGSLIEDPSSVRLYKSRIGEGKIAVVDEHNLDAVAHFLQYRSDVEKPLEKLTKALKEAKAKRDETDAKAKAEAETAEYEDKVHRVATHFGIDTEGKTLDELVAEVRAAQEEAKKAQTPTTSGE
jgi:Asp-tRNA(Asn)/Glu-tRNA(Gln) amidotransferase A subunit family amidase